MKTKPHRHKKENTFQFKSFSTRLEEVDVDIFRRITHRNEDTTEEIETYFYEALQKWNVLNLTDGYTAFKKEVRDIVTLPQLLHKKQHVIDILMKYLQKHDVLFLQPILELIVAVARDLQKEFYEYFPKFLTEIICLLETKDAEQIEYAFTTLAYLFKFLWRYLIRNVKTVITLVLPLLSDTQPVYINRFAAESFAFVVRRIRDKPAFLNSVLHILKANVDSVSGYGKLLFEIVSGTSGQFHSCAEEMLQLYFNALQEPKSVNQNLVYELLKEIITCTVQNIHHHKCKVMWDVTLETLDTFIEKAKLSLESSEKEYVLVSYLRLIYIIVNYKSGVFIIDAAPLMKRLIVMMDAFTEDNILREVINISVAILLATNVKLMQENTSRLLLKIIMMNNVELMYSAVESLTHYSLFEMLILPHILRRSISNGFDSKTLVLFAKLISAKAPPCLSGIPLDKWRKYILDIRNIKAASIDYFSSELTTLSTDDISLDAVRILVILPHLKPLREEFVDKLNNGLISLYNRIVNYNSVKDSAGINELTFIFLLTLESIIHISEPKDFHEFLVKSNVRVIDLINEHHDKLYILNAIDLCLTYFAASQYREYYVNFASFEILHNKTVKKMSSPYSNIRLITSHLYFLFANVEGLLRNVSGDKSNPMELAYMAECEPLTISSYRNKLMYLKALQFESNALDNLDPKYLEFPLRCLIGNLYVNFSLAWKPVCVFIANYGTAECEQFWPIFLSEMMHQDKPVAERKPSFDCHVISSLSTSAWWYNDKPDFSNYKILLWKCMAHFAEYAESKNRYLTVTFIDFVNKHFFKSNSEDAKSCNIEKNRDEALDNDANDMEVESADERDEDENDEEEENNEKEKNDKKEVVTVAKATQRDALDKSYRVKLLIAQLEVFSKMLNPKVFYREAEIHQIYLDLLSSKNPNIQKLALLCLLTYKPDYLLPYAKHMENLITEKTLKNAIVHFKLDRESNVIQEQHRKNLVPIVMRIVYAKMVRKLSTRAGGKAGGYIRRKMILRFLSGAEEDEMITFIRMAFKHFASYTSPETDESFDLKQHIRRIIDTVDLKNTMPPKRMQSAINLLAIVIEQFGGKMTAKLLPYLLRLMICVLAEINGILQRSEEVYAVYLPSIKNVRTSCVVILARFYAHFEDYDWKQQEIDSIYDVVVFPFLEKLPVEGIYSPTALLKLFVAWSENSRYYPLFVKHRENDKSISPLPFIVRLLVNPKTHPSVVNTILEMFEKMLTLQDYRKPDEDHGETPYLPLTPVLTNLLEVDEKVLSSGVNYGSVVLLSHVPQILDFLKVKLKKSNKIVTRTELTILSRISEFATEAETCDTLLTLLLPILSKKAASGKNEEVVMDLLATVMNLLKIVNKPEVHARAVIPLTGLVSDIAARKLVVQLYNIIAEKCTDERGETMMRESKMLTTLNAWDHRWIDQPDFKSRLQAFGEITETLKNSSITLEFGVAVIYNCFYFLKTQSNLMIQDYSSRCLKLICSHLVKEYKGNASDRRYLMDETILVLLRKGIVSKNEVVRSESIILLGHMAAECADVHPVLRDLSQLVNRVDPEVDFFENFQHPQLHRNARALLKFCTLAKTLKKPMNPRTLTQFIFPLCSSYLCNEAYLHKNSIVDAAIKTVSIVCRLLPWHHYEIILKHYLGKLRSSVDFQRQIVRIIVAILDSFHYDVSKYKLTEEIAEIERDVGAVNEGKNTVEGKNDKTENVNLEDTTQDAEGELEEALNNDVENTEEMEEKAEMVEKDNDVMKEEHVPIIKKKTLLSRYGAKRVMFSISNNLLPQLYRSIVARTQRDNTHKINRKKFVSEMEEEDLLRVPIALAFVKLLQKMPESVLNTNLPGVFMKLCTFLKSRMESVRRATREILQNIMITLGPKYLHYLLKEMNTLLTKGYQVHVLAYTIQSVLSALRPHFQKFDIDNNLQSILSVCKVDLFGLTAEEKDAIGIVKRVSEAKSTKSYDIFHISAQFITSSCLLDLIMPLKEMLIKTHSHRTIQKIVECLRNVTLGLVDNTYIPLEHMLIFLHGLVSESIPDLKPEEEKKSTESSISEKPDCFIIQPAPKSMLGIRTVAKTTKNTNAHILIEFGLKLYHILLKRERIHDAEYKFYIEPTVPLLTDCLNSQHVKSSTLAIQCLNWLLKMNLATVNKLIPDISNAIFNILHKYAASGLCKGDNFDLVMATFKCLSIAIRDMKDFTITDHRLKLLLLYAEQNLQDSDKQSAAFSLLKAIIHRKIYIPELSCLMEKVSTLSITSELEHVRSQSRSLSFAFILKYMNNSSADKQISFFLTQLSYETQVGRLSALEMIHTIITGFPLNTITAKSGVIFVMTSLRLINDDDPVCRKLSAKCIKEMIIKLSSNYRNKLFDITLKWLDSSEITHRTLAAQLCGIFVSTEKDAFDSRLNKILPLLIKQFHANFVTTSDAASGRFVRPNNSVDLLTSCTDLKDPEKTKDHHLFQVLQLLLKMSAHCTSFLTSEQYKDAVSSFAEYSQILLAHPHLWIRLAAAQLIGFIFAVLDIDRIVELLNNPKDDESQEGYIYSKPIETLRSLILDLVAQLYPDMIFEELADQVVKNLIFITKILKLIKEPVAKNSKQIDEDETKCKNNLSLSWLVRRLRKAVNMEIVQAPKSTSVRTAMFKFIAGVVTTVSIEYLNSILFDIMSPLVREITMTEEANTELHKLAKEVASMIKKSVGNERYVELLSRVENKLDIKKAERRKIRAQQFVVDPDLAAKRKLAKQQKKKVVKKKKLDNIRGKKVAKKRKIEMDQDEL